MLHFSAFGVPTDVYGIWSESTVSDGAWHHAGSTYDGTTAKRYLDAVEIGSLAILGTPASNVLLIGERVDQISHNMRGRLDDVRIYDRALSAEEVGALFDEDGWGFWLSLAVTGTA